MVNRKLVIFETTHHETLPAILDLSDLYFEKTAVFLKESSYRNLCNNRTPEKIWTRTAFFIQGSDQSNRHFIKEALSFLAKNGYTHLHISTLDNNILFFTLKIRTIKDVQITLSIQALNEYCTYAWGDLRDITESIAKRILRRRIQGHRVFSPLMVAEFQQRLPGLKCVYIPPRFFSPGISPLKKTTGPFKIVIAGSVDPKRRDYHFAFEFFDYFLSGRAHSRTIQLVVLGNSNTDYGTAVIARLQTLESDSFSLLYYRENVPQSAYEQQLSEADILWSPIQVATRGIRKGAEIYGRSTASGLTGDILFNCTPALVPKGFIIPEHYEQALLSYGSTEELKDRITKFMDDPDLARETREKIRTSLSFFVKENFKRAFEQLMEPGERKDV